MIVTWNSDLFASNSSATVLLTYDTQEQGTVAWYSPSVPNIKGYVNIFMESAWLLGASGNDTSTGQNLTFSFLSTPLGGGQNITKPGPMISLTVDPSTLPRVELPNLPGKYGLEIGLPIGLVAFVLIVLGIWCGMRKNNQSWAKVRGHSKDYMSKRARRRGRSGKDAAIQLEEYDRRQEAFSDEVSDFATLVQFLNHRTCYRHEMSTLSFHLYEPVHQAWKLLWRNADGSFWLAISRWQRKRISR